MKPDKAVRNIFIHVWACPSRKRPGWIRLSCQSFLQRDGKKGSLSYPCPTSSFRRASRSLHSKPVLCPSIHNALHRSAKAWLRSRHNESWRYFPLQLLKRVPGDVYLKNGEGIHPTRNVRIFEEQLFSFSQTVIGCTETLK